WCLLRRVDLVTTAARRRMLRRWLANSTSSTHSPSPDRQAFDEGCEEGDLNPQSTAEFSGIFSGSTAKNRHQPPPTVSGGHKDVACAGDVCPTASSGRKSWERRARERASV